MAACLLLSFLRKAFFSAAFLVFFTLTSCSSSWVTETVTDYLKKKTGLEVKVKEVSFTLRDLAFEMKGLSLNYKKGPSTWEITAAQAKVDLDWYFAEENLPWPSIKIKTIAVRQPVISARLPETKQKWDWAALLKKLPDLEQVELSDLLKRPTGGIGQHIVRPGRERRHLCPKR